MQPGNTKTKAPAYFLGLPMWSNSDWLGSLYPPGTNSKSYLLRYSRVFNSVEGNTTFYALPSESTVSSWREQVEPGFRFCFKLPREITHELLAAGHKFSLLREHLLRFFKRLEPIAQFLGPFMIQLPKQFAPGQLHLLQQLVECLPKEHTYNVEVRHPGFFDRCEYERDLNQLLHRHGVNRVCFDSRALFSWPADSEALQDAQRKKPRLPVHAIATAGQPIVRFIGANDQQHNVSYLMPWVKKVKQWCSEGIVPIMFIHTPDNIDAPQLAFTFHQLLADVEGWRPLQRTLTTNDQLSIF